MVSPTVIPPLSSTFMRDVPVFPTIIAGNWLPATVSGLPDRVLLFPFIILPAGYLLVSSVKKQTLAPCNVLTSPTTSLSSASDSFSTSPPWEHVLFSVSHLILCCPFFRNCRYSSAMRWSPRVCIVGSQVDQMMVQYCLDLVFMLYLLRHKKQECFPQFCIVQPQQQSIFKLDLASFSWSICLYPQSHFVRVIFPGSSFLPCFLAIYSCFWPYLSFSCKNFCVSHSLSYR